MAPDSHGNLGLLASSELGVYGECPSSVLQVHTAFYLDCFIIQNNEVIVSQRDRLLPRAVCEDHCGEGRKRVSGRRWLLEATPWEPRPDNSPLTGSRAVQGNCRRRLDLLHLTSCVTKNEFQMAPKFGLEKEDHFKVCGTKNQDRRYLST